jgi:polyphosphate kinase
VKARLLVRGICSLVPGVEGMSGNIEVRSVVGRFLEHSRIFVFNNNANPRVFLSSADWMSRNLGRRVELLFELTREELKEHLVNVMETYWKDKAKARELRFGTGYARLGEGEERFNAQEFFIRHYTGKQ